MDLALLDDSTIISLNQAKQLFSRVPEVMDILAPMRDAFDDNAPSIELAVLLIGHRSPQEIGLPPAEIWKRVKGLMAERLV